MCSGYISYTEASMMSFDTLRETYEAIKKHDEDVEAETKKE